MFRLIFLGSIKTSFLRFSGNLAFSGLDTKAWRVIVANKNNPHNTIFTPFQTDGYSCGVLSAMIGVLFRNVRRVAYEPIFHLCTGACNADASIYVV